MRLSYKTRLFLISFVTLFIMLVPQVCAQSKENSRKEAAELRQKFVDYGKKFIGCPYASGATGPTSFDCSGYVYAVSRESVGYQLPRMTKNMLKYSKVIDDSKREPGDLVFFKTTSSGDVSHVGIYMGKSQFLHCASDGPNTGVIVSSLKESYWKTHYYCTARFLPASEENGEKSASMNSTDSTDGKSAKKLASESSESASTGGANSYEIVANGSSNRTFLDRLFIDSSFDLDWNFFTPDEFRLFFRGLSANGQVRYAGDKIQPGLGFIARWDAGTKVFQLPLIASLTVGEYFKIFAGPVFTFGNPRLPGDSDKKIKGSVFPGIIGLCWNTPSFSIKSTKICFEQDLHYTVYNRRDGAALSANKSFASGLVFSSGIRVTLPMKEFFK